jgi:hypothetical protein
VTEKRVIGLLLVFYESQQGQFVLPFWIRTADILAVNVLAFSLLLVLQWWASKVK